MQIENLGVVIVLVFCAFILGFIATIFMERRFWNWLAYSLALFPVALIHLFVIGVADNTETRAPKIGSLIIFLLVCSTVYGIYRQMPNAFPFSLIG